MTLRCQSIALYFLPSPLQPRRHTRRDRLYDTAAKCQSNCGISIAGREKTEANTHKMKKLRKICERGKNKKKIEDTHVVIYIGICAVEKQSLFVNLLRLLRAVQF